MKIHIGLDDLDSPLGQCTTYVTFLLAKRIIEKKLAVFLDYPYLVRLNPNVPFKTRGNGATSLHLEARENSYAEVEEEVIKVVEENAERHGKTQPTAVIVRGEIPGTARKVYMRALRELVPRRYVEELVSATPQIKVYPDAGRRGLVGALAAVGAYPLREYTYELLAYRDPSQRVPERGLREEFFIEIDRKYRPTVFATYDYSEKRVLAVPHGPDPVLFGIRALDPRPLEELLVELSATTRHSYVIYKTNQATNAHLTAQKPIAMVRPYDSVLVEGEVHTKPEILPGGHVKLVLKDQTGSMQVMVYRETGRLNRVSRMLRPKDRIVVGGGAVPRKGLTLNAEQILVKHVEPTKVAKNPKCPRCGATMKSAGRGKGFKCPKCGFRDPHASKTVVYLQRRLEPGLYVASPRAYRHLTKPPEIYGMEAEDVFVEKWISWPRDS